MPLSQTVFFLSVNATPPETKEANELGLAIMPIKDITPPGFLWIDRATDGTFILKDKIKDGDSETIAVYPTLKVAYENVVSLLATAAIQPWRRRSR